jgi:Permuted papain-like amidase enzyme, YaeF/YiiX, C92 family
MDIFKTCTIRWLSCCLIFLLAPLLFLQFSCNNSNGLTPLIVTRQDSLLKIALVKRAYEGIANAKQLIQTGDIITRTGNDFTSESLRSLNQRDKTYSHCGIASIEKDSLFIYHALGGEWNPDEKLKRESFESFAAPHSNNRFGIFRFDIPDTTKALLIQVAHHQFKNELPFDMDFDLATNDRMYCAEFIYKSLLEASHQQLVFNKSSIGKFTFVGVDDIILHPLSKKIVEVVFK